MLPVTLAGKIPWLASASRKRRWLIGVSGGADSVALLHLLVAEGFRNLVVCHLDHCLRGRASTEDAKFVGRLAGKLGLAYETARANVKERMKQRGESMETAARNARLNFFGACVGKYRCNRILLAHHADDQAETVLWNLLRGSHGLKGMSSEKKLVSEFGVEMEFSRPLLELRHAELVAWLVSQGHRWREDSTNAAPLAVRNRLRNEALPLLAEISGRDATLAFVRGAADTEEMESLVSWALEQSEVRDPQGRLHLGTVRKLPLVLQRIVLRKFLIDHQIPSPDRALIESAMSLLDVKNPAAINLPGGARLRRREARLWIDR